MIADPMPSKRDVLALLSRDELLAVVGSKKATLSQEIEAAISRPDPAPDTPGS
jgi:hypothetical protein